jgi:hypothetical protein
MYIPPILLRKIKMSLIMVSFDYKPNHYIVVLFIPHLTFLSYHNDGWGDKNIQGLSHFSLEPFRFFNIKIIH